jgi:hypothetical protein
LAGFYLIARLITFLNFALSISRYQFRAINRVPIFSIRPDHPDIGRMHGRQLSALLPDGGSVLHIKGPSTSLPAKERTAGSLDTKLPTIQLIGIRGHWT